ncbi:hypothetical protein [Methylibium rhizosphaerae]|uniref:hypothetical protein n=1 Tax=Methylibium rhizosphaerae TaxID=2570323 RepID=UPI00112C517A|nr:hypothetical protein [Methylibium rhizosphaerae]
MNTKHILRWFLFVAASTALLGPGLVVELPALPNTLRHTLGLILAVGAVFVLQLALFQACAWVVQRTAGLRLLIRLLLFAALTAALIPAIWLCVFPLAFLFGLIGQFVVPPEAGSVLYWSIHYMGSLTLKALLSTAAVFICPTLVAFLALVSARSPKSLLP